MDSPQTATTLVDFLGQYGVTGLLVVLGAAIVYLYRQQAALAKEVRATVEKYAAGLATCQQETLTALRASTEAVTGVKQSLDELRRSIQ